MLKAVVSDIELTLTRALIKENFGKMDLLFLTKLVAETNVTPLSEEKGRLFYIID